MKGQVILLSLLLLASVPLSTASGSSDARFVHSTSVVVFSDGTAEVNQTLTPMNMSSITLPLLSPQAGNILAVSDRGTAVSYQIAGGNITLSTFGVTRATLIYDTEALTTKQGSTWNLSLDSPYNITLTLPYKSTVLSLSRAPGTYSTVAGEPVLSLAPGSWQVSYGLPISVPSSSITSTVSSTSSTGVPQGPASAPLNLWLPGIALAAFVLISGGAVLALRRRSIGKELELRTDDREILSFIQENGGKVSEVQIRERFSLPRTSAWRQAKRLEKLGVVKITKVGKQNTLELVRTEPEPGSSSDSS